VLVNNFWWAMFKFDEYPEIKKAYEEQKRLNKILNKAEKRIKPNDEELRLKAQKAFDNLNSFHDIFALLIYNTIQERKPKLYNRVKDSFSEWDQVFPNNWEKFDEGLKNDLVGLVLEIGYGSYWLPDEYYDEKPIDGCIPAPTTHTKPFKCW